MAKKDALGNPMGPLTPQGAIELSRFIITEKLKEGNINLFREINQIYQDPDQRQLVENVVIDYLYNQEFMRTYDPVTLDQILNPKNQ